MSFLGDLAPGAIVSIKFDTSSGFAGPITLAGAPSATCYKDGGLTQSAVGVVLTVDFDGVVGLHHVAVDTSADAFYAAGSSFDVVMVAGTVDEVSIAGKVLGSFSLARSAAYARVGAPAGLSLAADVAAVKAQTAAIEVDTQDLQARTPAALVGGRTDASVGAMATDTLTSGAVAASAVTELQAGLMTSAGYTAPPSAATVAAAVWDYLSASATTVGSLGKRIVDYLTGDVFARIGAPAGASLSADVAAVSAKLPALVGGRVDASVGAMAANTLTASALATDAVTEIQAGITAPSAAAVADAVWDEALSGHVVAGSAGAALTASGGAADPNAAIASSYAAGTIGHAISLISPGRVTVVSPVSADGSVITIYRGDDHFAVDGREIGLSSTDWANLTGATGITLTLFTLDTGRVAGTFTGALVAYGGATQEVKFEPTAAWTGGLNPGAPAYAWAATCTLVTTGHKYTLQIGTATVVRVRP